MQKRKLSDISTIILHCSATDASYMDDIVPIRWGHIYDNGWEDIGYHYFIRKDGTIQIGRQLDWVGAHCEGYNINSIGICLSGEFVFNKIQFAAAAVLIDVLAEYLNGLKPKSVYPHRHFNKRKTCPNFSLANVAKFSTQKSEVFLFDV